MIGKKTFLAAFLLLFPFLHVATSGACDVLVVKSADIKPYDEAIEGFRSAVDCKVREINLSDLPEREVERSVLNVDPDLIFAVGMDALARLQRVKETPVVYTMVPSPQAASGRKNTYGVSMYIAPDRFLDAITEVFHAKRVGLVYNPQNTEQFVREARQAAESKGVDLVVRKTGRAGDVPALIEGMKDKIDVFWMLPDATVVNAESVKYMLLFSFQSKVPVFSFSKKYVEMGAIAALNVVPFDLGVQAAEIARRVIGEGTLRLPSPVDARKTALVVNKKVARKMGLKIREDVLRKAEDAN